jgi:hypothetical protein
MTSVGRVWVPRNGIEDRRNAIDSRPLFSQWLESIVAKCGKSARYVLWEPGAGDRSWPPGVRAARSSPTRRKSMPYLLRNFLLAVTRVASTCGYSRRDARSTRPCRVLPR